MQTFEQAREVAAQSIDVAFPLGGVGLFFETVLDARQQTL